MKVLGNALIFALDIFTMLLLGVLFGIVFIGAQIASWTGSKS